MTESKPPVGELLPCPFCGGHADMQTRSGPYAGWYVSCHTEDCMGNPSNDGFSFVVEDYARTAWNTRSGTYIPADDFGSICDALRDSNVTLKRYEILDGGHEAFCQRTDNETILALARKYGSAE